MKKLITITIAMMLLLTACGSGASTQQTADTGSSSTIFKDKSIDGTWHIPDGDDELTDETLSIEGEDALLKLWTGSAYVGKVDTKAHTITFSNMGLNDGDTVFDYKLIGDQLALTCNAEQSGDNDFRTMAFERVKEGGEDNE